MVSGSLLYCSIYRKNSIDHEIKEFYAMIIRFLFLSVLLLLSSACGVSVTNEQIQKTTVCIPQHLGNKLSGSRLTISSETDNYEEEQVIDGTIHNYIFSLNPGRYKIQIVPDEDLAKDYCIFASKIEVKNNQAIIVLPIRNQNIEVKFPELKLNDNNKTVLIKYECKDPDYQSCQYTDIRVKNKSATLDFIGKGKYKITFLKKWKSFASCTMNIIEESDGSLSYRIYDREGF